MKQKLFFARHTPRSKRNQCNCIDKSIPRRIRGVHEFPVRSETVTYCSNIDWIQNREKINERELNIVEICDHGHQPTPVTVSISGCPSFGVVVEKYGHYPFASTGQTNLSKDLSINYVRAVKTKYLKQMHISGQSFLFINERRR